MPSGNFGKALNHWPKLLDHYREGLLTRWKREAQADGRSAFSGPGSPRDAEVAQLKRELARVKKERDFLKEAATFFARESS